MNSVFVKGRRRAPRSISTVVASSTVSGSHGERGPFDESGKTHTVSLGVGFKLGFLLIGVKGKSYFPAHLRNDLP